MTTKIDDVTYEYIWHGQLHLMWFIFLVKILNYGNKQFLLIYIFGIFFWNMIITHTLHLFFIYISGKILEYGNNSYIIIKINIFKYYITNFEILFNWVSYKYNKFSNEMFSNFFLKL